MSRESFEKFVGGGLHNVHLLTGQTQIISKLDC